eukprot:gnl/Hemi2/26633_TR8934_c0_g1_i1.p2 gnl/Hemi2/26633_TR8934_c0_g1~~gnl/Hemi2/26633_TR8934_c0_g1_i1.p2  ORF type:complete len:126 (-),score=49.15 gnl/Hemi2/26633_TR8934_c0_g1_i1:117-494(-)
MELIASSKSGDLDSVQTILQSAAGRQNISAQDRYGNTALYWAAREGHRAVCEALLQHGASSSQANGDGYTPLMQACAHGHAAVVRLLLAEGADPHCKDHYGRDAKDKALRYGFPDLVPLLGGKKR